MGAIQTQQGPICDKREVISTSCELGSAPPQLPRSSRLETACGFLM